MKTLVPAQTFLRVADKFFPAFALEDQHLSSGATLLYLYLFRLAGKDGCCWPSQAALARASKSCVRSVQGYINRLVGLGYIQIERDGTRNVYRLVLSGHVQAMIELAGVDTLSDNRTIPATITQSAPATITQGSSATPFTQSAPAALIAQGAISAPSHTQILQRQGAISAHHLRKNIRKKSPLSPLSAPNQNPLPDQRKDLSLVGGVFLPAAPVEIEKGKPACEARDAKVEFEALFASWPRRQDKFQAERAYASLAKSGELPPLQTLLDVVARFKTKDRAWRNGFAPNLRFWLIGKRWLDDVTPVTHQPGTPPSSGHVPPPLSAEVIAHAQELYALREKHGSAVLSDARKEQTHQTPLANAADALCTLWPHEDRGKIMSCLVLANIRGISPDSVVGKAQQVGQALMLPVETWFRQVAA